MELLKEANQYRRLTGIRLAAAELVTLAGIRLAVGGMVTLAAVLQHKEFSQGQEQMGFLSHQLGPMVLRTSSD